MFFREPLENFLYALRSCSRYLEGLPRLALHASKKTMTIRRINPIIIMLGKVRKFQNTTLSNVLK